MVLPENVTAHDFSLDMSSTGSLDRFAKTNASYRQHLDRVGLASSEGALSPGTASLGKTLTNTTPKLDASAALLEHQHRGLCLQALQSQIKAAEATGSFLSPQGLQTTGSDNAIAAALSLYLRDDCRAKFVDLSSFACFGEAAVALADAVRCGMRATRSLTLDGNDIGSRSEVLEAWCTALEEHPGLQHVSLRNTRLTDEGAKRLAKVLRGHPVLFSLDIGLNRIGMSGAVALEDALGDNDVLLEVNCQECDLSVEMQSALSQTLQRNRDRFQRPGGAIQALENLRRTRAEAVTASAAFSLKLAQQSEHARPASLGADAPDAVLAMFAALEPGEVPFVYDSGQGNDVYKEDEPDGVFFDAGIGVCVELNNRCEAGWRYSAADHEALCELRKRTSDLRAARKHDKQRGEETRERMAMEQRKFREQIELPAEERMWKLREELAAVRVEVGDVQKVCIQQKMELSKEEQDREDMNHEREIYKLGAHQFEISLKQQNREVQQEVECLQSKLQEIEAATEAMAAENVRYRSWLHAARFETEAERFAPHRELQIGKD